MAQIVQIELQVNEQGAITAFRSLGSSATQAGTAVRSVGTAGGQMGPALAQGATQANSAVQSVVNTTAQVAPAAQKAGTAGAAAMQHVGQHALNSMDSVRLFRDEFGIHIPRSMEKTMAQSKLVMSALNAIKGAMVAVGAVGVGIALASQFADVISSIRHADDEINKFDRDLSNAARKRSFDMASPSSAPLAYAANDQRLVQGDALHSKALTNQNIVGTVMKYTGNLAARQELTWLAQKAPDTMAAVGLGVKEEDQNRRNQAREIANAEPLKAEEERHRAVLAHHEVEAKAAGSMRAGSAKALAEYNVSVKKADEDQLNRFNERQILVKQANGNLKPGDKGYTPVDANTGRDAESDAAKQVAGADLRAKNVEFARQESDEIIQLRNQADNASLRGYALLESQRMQARNEFVRKYGTSAEAMSAIDRRFHDEEHKQSEEALRDISRREQAASAAGLRGVSSIEARGRTRLTDIDSDLAGGKYAALGSQAEQQAGAERDRVTARKETNAELIEEQTRFTDTVSGIAASATERELQGFARIRAEGSKELLELQKRFEEVYGKMRPQDAASAALYDQGLSQLNRGRSAIGSSTAAQGAELARKNAEDTEKLERDAARSALPQRRQREQAIYDTYAERLAAYQRMLQQQEISEGDYLRRTAAAERQMQADLAQEAKAQRDRLAGEIAPFLRNPLEAARHFGEEQASKYAATTLMQLTNRRTSDGKGEVLSPGHSGLRERLGFGNKAHEAAQAAQAVSATVNAGTAIIHIAGGAQFTSQAAGATGVPSALKNEAPAFGAGVSLASGGSSTNYAVSDANAGAGPYGLLGAEPSWTGVAGSGSAATGGMLSAGGSLSMSRSASDIAAGFPTGDKIADQARKTASKPGVSGTVVGNGISGAAGLYSAYESNGGVGAGLSGAMAGAQFGSVFGPAGAFAGAAAGAVLGFIGIGGANKAKAYYDKEVHPRITDDITQYGMGSKDYQSTYDDLVALDKEARQQTKQFGMGGKREWDGHIHPEIIAAQTQLTREQKSGRSQFGMSAAQFHGGGRILGFGSFATSPTEGMINVEKGETVMHRSASDMHGDALGMMLGNATRRQMTDYYAGPQAMASSYRATMQQAAFGQAGHTFNMGHTYNVDAIDVQSFEQRIMQSKHTVRAAQNASLAENSGGSDFAGV